MSKFKVKELLKPVRSPGKLKKSHYKSYGSFPVIDQGNNVVAGYTEEESLVIRKPLPIIVFGDHTRALKFIKMPFVRGADGTQLLYPKEDIATPIYFYYALKNLNLSNYHYARHFKFLKEELVEIPSIDTQKKVATILSAYDDLIEINLKRTQSLEAMARLLYFHYFEGLESDDWESFPLGEYLRVHRGKSYKSTELSEKDGLPFVNLKNLNRGGGFREDGIKGFTGTYKPTHQVYKGDIVMAVTDMTQERMIVARPARVPTLKGGFGVISMDLVKIEPKDDIEKDYLYALLRWSEFSNEVKNHANGANVLHLLPARITSYSMPIAPIELQRDFSAKVGPIFDLIDTLQQKNKYLVKGRDLLLPRLMSGEIKL